MPNDKTNIQLCLKKSLSRGNVNFWYIINVLLRNPPRCGNLMVVSLKFHKSNHDLGLFDEKRCIVPDFNCIILLWLYIAPRQCLDWDASLPLPSTGDEASETLDGVRWTFTSSVGEVSLICNVRHKYYLLSTSNYKLMNRYCTKE